MTWSLKHIEQLKAEGKIRDYIDTRKTQKSTKKTHDQGGRKVSKHFPKRSKEKDWIAWNLLYWCNEHAVSLEEEYRFHPERKWRFDWCIPSLLIAIEYEGGIFMKKSGHSNFAGQNRDIDKYNSAQSLGWKVTRLNAVNYQTLLDYLENSGIER
jgi:hypothetical protein